MGVFLPKSSLVLAVLLQDILGLILQIIGMNGIVILGVGRFCLVENVAFMREIVLKVVLLWN